MWIKDIKLINFRNYNCQKIKLHENINVFYGQNAQGKTNIIESIFMSSIGKSFRTNKEKELIKFNEEKAMVEINFQKTDRNGNIKIEIGEKKQVYLNGIKLKKLSELLGNINIVIFTPDDINILKGGPQNRRKFLDIMISQLRPNYMHLLSLYSKTMEQRNNYLKQIKLENKDENLLDIWDEKLIDYGMKIYEYRKEFIEKLQSKIENIHKGITDEKEEIEIKYLQVIYDDIGEYPILLLDDFMSELDCKRRENFLNHIKNIQVIITCTEKITLEKLNYFSYNVINGEVIEKE